MQSATSTRGPGWRQSGALPDQRNRRRPRRHSGMANKEESGGFFTARERSREVRIPWQQLRIRNFRNQIDSQWPDPRGAHPFLQVPFHSWSHLCLCENLWIDHPEINWQCGWTVLRRAYWIDRPQDLHCVLSEEWLHKQLYYIDPYVVFELLGWYANIHLFDLHLRFSWTIAKFGTIISIWFLWMTHLPPSHTAFPNSISQGDNYCLVFLCTVEYKCKQVTGVYISVTSKRAQEYTYIWYWQYRYIYETVNRCCLEQMATTVHVYHVTSIKFRAIDDERI